MTLYRYYYEDIGAKPEAGLVSNRFLRVFRPSRWDWIESTEVARIYCWQTYNHQQNAIVITN